MRKTLSAALFLASLCIMLASCGGKKSKQGVEALPYSPFVEGFTTGKIMRTTPVYLIFSQDVSEDKMTEENLRRAMKIRPAVDGTFSFENSRTVAFRPSDEFKRDQSYSITADLSRFFDVNDSKKEFVFSFSTYPLSIRGAVESLKVNEDESSYNIKVKLFTSDAEQPATVESVINFSEKTEVVWEHSANGKEHNLTMMAVPAGNTEVRSLTVSVGANKFGAAKEDIVTLYVPAAGEFGLYDARLVTTPERYIELTFTQNLDPEQDMTGLAVIEFQETTEHLRASVEGNIMRLYPEAGTTGRALLRIDASVRNHKGEALGEQILRDFNLGSNEPAVEFVGQGTIIPRSSQLTVPFRAVWLRGVVVTVVRVLEKNVGQFLQQNNLDEASSLIRVGIPVARKTIFFSKESDLSSWGTYAVDLRELIEPEPGAIYRVQISFNQDLSAYECEGVEQKSEQELLAQDQILFRQELERFDDGQSYYYYDDYEFEDFDWSRYDYYTTEDPCSYSFYYGKNISRNVLATDLGLIAKSSGDGSMLVSVHNLLSTDPESGVQVEVFNYQHISLGSGTTDSNGDATIRISKSKPFYLVAQKGNQRSYMRVDNNQALSLSSFDISGQRVQKGLKGLIYGERGVWRPGDTVNLSVMINDRTHRLPAGHPVVLELRTPLGQMYATQTQPMGEMGLSAFRIPVDHDAPTGAWVAEVEVGGVSFARTIRIETVKPNRLKIDLRFGEDVIAGKRTAAANLHTEWLHGAPARNLAYEIYSSYTSAATRFDKYTEFTFDDPTKAFESGETLLASGNVDAEGDAVVTANFDTGDASPGMVTATLTTRVYEESGDFSIDVQRVTVSPYEVYAGIRSPQRDKSQLGTGQKHTFEVATVDYQGKARANRALEVRVYKVNWYWWWSSNLRNLANYISNSHNTLQKTLSVTTDANGKGSFQLEYSDEQWGSYYISVRDVEGWHSSGLIAYFDWPYLDGRRDPEGSQGANLLNFKLDKTDYKPGEKINMTLPSSVGSLAVVTIENGTGVLSISRHRCEAGQTVIQIDVTEQMMPNAYAYVTLLQPHGATANDLPIRMYGVQPFTVTSPTSRLNPLLKAPDEIKPEENYEITVSEKDGRAMAYTVAIVDEGLLDLTRFKTPDPWAAFNAREALGVSTWDLYNHVVGAYGGRIEELFGIGGDGEAEPGPKAIVNRFKPVVTFDGPFVLGKGEKRKHSYKMPNYNGRVRAMIVAGDGSAYGNTEKSIAVRKPVMVLGTLPRVIGTSEEMSVPATVFATEKGVGKVKVTVTVSGNMEIMGPATRELDFNDISDKQALFRIKTGATSGVGSVTLTATSSKGDAVSKTDIEIRSVRRTQVKTITATLEPGSRWTQKPALPGPDGTNKVALEVSSVKPLNLNSRLEFLLGYPHGCLEQTTSKGFPQLYVGEFATLSEAQSKLAQESVRATIQRLRSFQTGTGGFAYWPGGTSTDAWSSTYATHFLVEAQSKGYLVPKSLMNNALSEMKLLSRGKRDEGGRSERMIQGYRLYVLALAGSPELGAMNRMKEIRNLEPMAKWMLAAAYTAAGRVDVAKTLTQQTTVDLSVYAPGNIDLTYGSSIRDQSIQLITLLAMDERSQAAQIANTISDRMSSDYWMSTQTTSFALMAMSRYLQKNMVDGGLAFEYSYGDAKGSFSDAKTFWAQPISDNASSGLEFVVQNKGRSTLFINFTLEGTPIQGEEEAYANKVGLALRYTDMTGNPIDVSSLQQGTNFMAEVTVSNPTYYGMNNLAITQIFPAGWEIMSTRFADSEGGDSYPRGVNYQDIRDDRVYSYVDWLGSGRQVTIKIPLAAVYEGVYYNPPVWCEAMYDNLTRANTAGTMTSVVR